MVPLTSRAGRSPRFGNQPLTQKEARRHRSGDVPLWRLRLGLKYAAPTELWPVKPVLLDTGVIVALLDQSEKHHQSCAHAVRAIDAPLITCEAVIAESCYLLRKLGGAPEAVLENVAAGIFQIAFQLSHETTGLKQILRKHRDRQIDLADACLIRLAEEFETADVLTLDRDFKVYRWGRNKAFRILPDLS